jgi:hypothetical protein
MGCFLVVVKMTTNPSCHKNLRFAIPKA